MTGLYTEITEVVVPSSVIAGELVSVTVRVRNLTGGALYICVYGYTIVAGQAEVYRSFSPQYALVEPEATYSFTSSFIMPNDAQHLHVWGYYWTGTEWYPDDYAYSYIALGVPVGGAITKKELEYNGARVTIPATNIPQGKRGLVHIWGRNDTSEAQQMGIYWIVKDPGGIVVEEYYAWEAWPYTGAGKEHEFIGSRFDLDKVGIYTINAGLLMNPDNPVYVDIYYGNLCTVKAVLEPTFSGFAVASFSKV